MALDCMRKPAVPKPEGINKAAESIKIPAVLTCQKQVLWAERVLCEIACGSAFRVHSWISVLISLSPGFGAVSSSKPFISCSDYLARFLYHYSPTETGPESWDKLVRTSAKLTLATGRQMRCLYLSPHKGPCSGRQHTFLSVCKNGVSLGIRRWSFNGGSGQWRARKRHAAVLGESAFIEMSLAFCSVPEFSRQLKSC